MFSPKEIAQRLSGNLTVVIDRDGTKIWRLNGVLHRDGGPALEFRNGTKEWWNHGKIHRIGGPAIEHADGTKEWWFNNSYVKSE